MTRKSNDKYISRTNAKDREDAITAMGEKAFWSVESNRNIYADPDVPLLFEFIFNSFIEIFNASGESVTWTDIYSYEKVRKIDFTQYEVNLIIKCISWANSKISEMRKENE